MAHKKTNASYGTVKNSLLKQVEEQDPNSDNSHTAISSIEVSRCQRCNFEHFRLSEHHDDGCNLLARYDFLLVIYSDLKSIDGTIAVKVSTTVVKFC